MNKTEARKECKQVWQEFLNPKVTLNTESQRKQEQLLYHFSQYIQQWPHETQLLLYIPLADEFNYISALPSQHFKYYAPCLLPDGLEFRHCELLSNSNGKKTAKKFTNMEQGAYGIWHPNAQATLFDWPDDSKSNLDTNDTTHIYALIPCLAVDSLGMRLGRGGGYYDRLRKQINTIHKIALLPSELCHMDFGAEKHDLKIDCAITQEGIQKF